MKRIKEAWNKNRVAFLHRVLAAVMALIMVASVMPSFVGKAAPNGTVYYKRYYANSASQASESVSSAKAKDIVESGYVPAFYKDNSTIAYFVTAKSTATTVCSNTKATYDELAYWWKRAGQTCYDASSGTMSMWVSEAKVYPITIKWKVAGGSYYSKPDKTETVTPEVVSIAADGTVCMRVRMPDEFVVPVGARLWRFDLQTEPMSGDWAFVPCDAYGINGIEITDRRSLTNLNFSSANYLYIWQKEGMQNKYYAVRDRHTNPPTWSIVTNFEECKGSYINYYPNGGSGTTMKSSIYENDGHTNATVAGCSFTRDHYKFASWNTKADGTGTSYSPGASLNMWNSWNLYAQWERIGWQVKYDSNGAHPSYKTVPTDAGWYKAGDEFTVLEAPEDLKKSGKVFDYWMGSDGKKYEPGNTYPMPSGLGNNDLKLSAVWKDADAYELRYDNNGENGSMASVPFYDDGIPENGKVTVPDNGFTSPRYTFLEWERDNEENSKYQPGNEFDFAFQSLKDKGLAAEKLTARWGAKLTYDDNDATDGDVPTDSKVYDFQKGEQAIVQGNTGNLVKSRHIFAGWDDEAKHPDLREGTYQDGSPVTFTKNKTIYAHWKESPEYRAVYHLNPPEKADAEEIAEADNEVPEDGEIYYNDMLKNVVSVLGAPSGMALTGYRFDGWALKEDGEVEFQKNDPYIIKNDTPTTIDFFAKWAPARKYNISYDINLPAGADSGDVTGPAPKDEKNYYNDKKNDKITVAPAGEMGIEGQTFDGWNTKADGTGDAYEPGDEIPVNLYSKSFTLYAQWKTHLTIKELDSPNKTYDGSADWNGTIKLSGIRPGDKVTAYADKAQYQNKDGEPDKNVGIGKRLELEDIYLTEKDADHYILVDENGAPLETYLTVGCINKREITLTPQSSVSRITRGNAIPDDLFSLKITKGGLASGDSLTRDFGTPEYKCVYTKPDGSKVNLAQGSDSNQPDDSYIITVSGVSNSNYDITLKTGSLKVVEPGTVQATVTYNANGGTGSAPEDPNSPYNVSSDADNPTMIKVLPNTNVTRSGYQFVGWDRNAKCSGTPEFPAGKSNTMALTKNETLYAVWKGATPLTITGLSYTSRTYDGTAKWDGSIKISKALPTDEVSLTYTAASYDTKNVGTGKTIKLTGVKLTGKDAGKYVLKSEGMYDAAKSEITVTSGAITKRPVTIAPKLPSKTQKNTEELPAFGIELADGTRLGQGDSLEKDFGTPGFTVEDSEGKAYAVDCDADRYTVKVKDLNNPNYEISYKDAVLNVTDASGKQKVTVSYDGNGAEGGELPEPENYYIYTDTTKNDTVTVAEEEPVIRGCRFIGWSTSRSAIGSGGSSNSGTNNGTNSGASGSVPAPAQLYHAGDTFAVQGDTTLYAVWQADTPLEITDFDYKLMRYYNTNRWQGDLKVTGITPGDDVEVTYEDGCYNQKNVGKNLTIVARDIKLEGADAFRYYLADSENSLYNPTTGNAVSQDGEIEKRPITIETVVPEGNLRAQNAQDDPTGKFSYRHADDTTTFALEEDLDDLNSSGLAYTIKDHNGNAMRWTDIKKAGFYYVETSGLSNPNYEISYLDGRLTVIDKYGTRPVALTYHANGAEGKVPVDVPDNEDGCYLVYEDPEHEYMTTHTMAPDELSKEGYKFKEWNTKADGTGTGYGIGEEIVMEDDVDLYAIYVGDTPLVITGLSDTVKPYDGTQEWKGEVLVSGADPEDNIRVTYTDGVYSDKNAGDGKVIKALGVTIQGENLDKYVIKDGKTARYDAEENAVIAGNGAIAPRPLEVIPVGAPEELDWSSGTAVYTVNQGEEVPGYQLFLPARSEIVNPDELEDFGDPEYHCTGVNGRELTDTSVPGYYRLSVNGLSHQNYEVEAGNSVVRVYAPGMQEARVNYRGNGGRGAAPIDNNLYATFDDHSLNSMVTVMGNTFTRTGYKFTGWNTKANGKGRSYQAGEEFRIMGDTVLYAMWERIPGTDTKVDIPADKTSGKHKDEGSLTVNEVLFSGSGKGSLSSQLMNAIRNDNTDSAQNKAKEKIVRYKLGATSARGNNGINGNVIFSDEKVPLGASPEGLGHGGLFSSCMLHWIIFLFGVLIMLYGVLRFTYIRNREKEEENIFFDRIIPVMAIPLSILFYFMIHCSFDIYAIISLLLASILSSIIIQKAYQKEETTAF